MRVITGIARGKKLKTLEGIDVRPTTDRVKESIFSIIHFDLEGANVLDLFCGSGQLGIEALSRGAKHATFVDNNKNSIAVTKDNLTATGLISNARVAHMDSFDFLKGTKSTFDIALLDPPYNQGILLEALPLLEKIMNPGGIVICEHEGNFNMPEVIGRLELKKSYKYNRIALSLLKIKEEQ
jgi:16S rRNA (guanine966-N2)-methyltransferase